MGMSGQEKVPSAGRGMLFQALTNREGHATLQVASLIQ